MPEPHTVRITDEQSSDGIGSMYRDNSTGESVAKCGNAAGRNCLTKK